MKEIKSGTRGGGDAERRKKRGKKERTKLKIQRKKGGNKRGRKSTQMT
jgi:hypothetical protein